MESITRPKNLTREAIYLKMFPIKGVWAVVTHNHMSQKYKNYISNISINDKEYWFSPEIGIGYNSEVEMEYSIEFYSDSEDYCAKKTYEYMKKNLKKVTRHCKLMGGHYTKYKKWQKWIDNYELVNNINLP